MPAPVANVMTVMPAIEGMQDGLFRVTLSETSSQWITVSFSFSGTATPNVDFFTTFVGMIAPGDTSADVVIDVTGSPMDDSDAEGLETVTMTLTSGTGYTVGASDSATLLIYDNDGAPPLPPPPPPVVIAETVRNANEGDSHDGVIRLTRTGDTSSALTVNYTVGGTAISGSDFTALSGTVTFAAGSATADVPVATIDDSVLEQEETVTLTLSAGSGYTVSPVAGSASVVIADDDSYFSFTLPDGEVGLIGFDIPYGLVDPDLPNQSVTPNVFNLTIDGQNFAYGTASYTTTPELHFAFGNLIGVTFAVNTPGTSYASVSVINRVATAFVGGVPLAAPVADTGPGAVFFDFSTISSPTAAMGNQTVTLRLKLSDGNTANIDVLIVPGATPTSVRDAFIDALDNAKISAAPLGTTGLKVKGKVGKEIVSFKFFHFADFGSDPPKFMTATKNKDGTFPVQEK